MDIAVDDSDFQKSLEELKVLTGKPWQEIVSTQAKLLARRLAALTPPHKLASGKTAVAIDVGRVYLRSSWFTEKFTFNNQKLNQRVQNAVREQNEPDLLAIFQNSARLNRIHIEPFDAAKLAAARINGRVNYPQPFSFPLTDQGQIEALAKQSMKAVGIAKAGWAYCAKLLGDSIPGWQDKPVGEVSDNSKLPENPYIEITNKVSYFQRLDSKDNIVGKSLEGRERDMIIAAEKEMEEAIKRAGF